MLHSIYNDILTVEIAEKGAELRSIKSKKDECEYLWQGDAKYWEDRSPIMFPICSSVFEGKYNAGGKEYELGLHGFAQYCTFSASKTSDSEISLTLTSSDETRKVYPFDFSLEIIYSLSGNALTATANIKNTGSETMHATFGAHPGFNVPLDGKSEFESYYIEFSEPSVPSQIVLSPKCAVTGELKPLAFENKKILRLRHDLFIPDGIFMSGMPKSLTLRSDTDSCSVTVKYDDMDYLGIWQEYGADTPFICIEPWCAPPTNDGKTREDIETKKGLFHIAAGDTRSVSYSIELN